MCSQACVRGVSNKVVIRGSSRVMVRWLTVLIALVAQGMSLMSPVCLVRCISPDGHECVELAGQDCGCCARTSPEAPQVCAVAKCDHDHEEEEPERHHEHDTQAGRQVRGEHCSCQHSPLESAPQVQTKSLTSDVMLAWHDALTAKANFTVITTASRLEFASRSLLRPQESPHLTFLATVVLRV